MEDSKISLSRYNNEKKLSLRIPKINTKHTPETKSVHSKSEEIGKKEPIKEENVSYKDKSGSFAQNLSNFQGTESQSNSMLL